MARLPSQFDLSGPASLRSGRPIASIDTSGLARGVQSLGNSIADIGEDVRKQRATVDVARAEAYKTQGLIDVTNEFSNDGDYSTFDQRAPGKTGDVVKNAANLIRDPQVRERWQLGAQTDAARTNDAIGDKSRALGKQAETVAFDDALEVNRRIYVDPDTPEDAKAKAKADIEGAISVGERNGLLTPGEAATRRDQFIRNADFSRAKLAAERDPSQFTRRGVVDRIVGAESGGNATAKNPNSSATGAGQFIASTWLNTVKEHRPDLLNGRTTAEVLALRNDGALSREMTSYLANDNAAFLRNQGIQPTDGDIYLAHFLGPRGAAQVLKADPSASVSSIVGQDAVNANPFLKGMSAADVRSWAGKKMGETTTPAYFNDLSPEQQQVVMNQAETRQRQISAENQGAIENVVQNAPTAIQNTGSYDGTLPDRQSFIDAYGVNEGTNKFNQFSSSLEVSEQAYAFRTMSAEDIQRVVNEAVPASSGNDAALETARYSALQKAAETTLASRNADPATYTRQAYPAVARAWDDAQTSGNYQAALTATAAAQRQLGIQNMQLMPKAVADQSVTSFKDANLPAADRLAAVSGLVFSTADPAQRQAVYDQLVGAGMPAAMDGVFEALARGDQGAASRLMEAVVTDPAKLPSDRENTPALINENVYSNVWAPGELGYTAYGLAYGDASSLERAQRGTELLNKAVRLRLSRGDDMDVAVEGAKKDLFGDKVVFTGDSSVNADLAVNKDVDQQVLADGLARSKEMFKQALNGQRDQIMAGAGAVDASQRSILDATTQNRINDILSEGVFVQTGNGVGLRDPYTGQFVAGADGRPLAISMDELLKPDPSFTRATLNPALGPTPGISSDLFAPTFEGMGMP